MSKLKKERTNLALSKQHLWWTWKKKKSG